jgi:hypothetical protein
MAIFYGERKFQGDGHWDFFYESFPTESFFGFYEVTIDKIQIKRVKEPVEVIPVLS